MIEQMIQEAETSVPKRTDARKSFLHSVFTTALEGGIGYWSECGTYHWIKPGTDHDEDLDNFHAVLYAVEDGWGVTEVFQPQFDTAEKGIVVLPEESQRQPLYVGIDVVERGVNLLVDKVIAATKSEDPEAPCSRVYLRQFVEAWLSDGEAGDYDTDGADLAIQLGLFGEIVYA
jgi:hypothetical protein